jgi:hypothetical protein
MNIGRKWVFPTMLAGSIVGGAGGGTLISSSVSQAATSTTPTATTATTATTPSTAPSGTFTPNENATHEAGESAAREAQEDAGHVPTVP